MSRHTNNSDCSMTVVVKLVGYNGDDHFLLLKLKGAGGLADYLASQTLYPTAARGKGLVHCAHQSCILPPESGGNTLSVLLMECLWLSS